MIELKKETIKKREWDVRVVDIIYLYDQSMLTICTILEKKDKIKTIATAAS